MQRWEEEEVKPKGGLGEGGLERERGEEEKKVIGSFSGHNSCKSNVAGG